MVVNVELGGISFFECQGDVTSRAQKREKMEKKFEFYMAGKGVTQVQQKRLYSFTVLEQLCKICMRQWRT